MDSAIASYLVLATVAKRLKPGTRTNPAPSLSSALSVWGQALAYMRFHYPDFKTHYIAQDSSKIKQYLVEQVKQGKLIRGRLEERKTENKPYVCRADFQPTGDLTGNKIPSVKGLRSAAAPLPGWFGLLPDSIPKHVWEVYVLVVKEPGQIDRVYNGSGTATYKGARARISTYKAGKGVSHYASRHCLVDTSLVTLLAHCPSQHQQTDLEFAPYDVGKVVISPNRRIQYSLFPSELSGVAILEPPLDTPLLPSQQSSSSNFSLPSLSPPPSPKG